MENVKTRIQTNQGCRFYSPDIQVGCREQAADSQEERAPKLVIEVLCNSTERRDRADKFFADRRLESLEEYMLVAQDTRRVEVLRRARGWEWELYTAPDARIRLDSVGAELAVEMIYKDIVLPD